MLALFSTLIREASSHDLWIERENKHYVLYQGHRYASHQGSEIVPYRAGTATRYRCITAEGLMHSEALPSVYPAAIARDCALLRIDFEPGYFSKNAWETRNVPKTALSGVIESWYALESIKLIEAPLAAQKPLGDGLEITPLENPLSLVTGDKFTVQVTDDGVPMVGVPVAYAGDTRGVTNQAGRIALRVRHTGWQFISTSHTEALHTPEADKKVRTSVLQFWVRP